MEKYLIATQAHNDREKKIVCNLGMIALSSDSIFYNLEEKTYFE